MTAKGGLFVVCELSVRGWLAEDLVRAAFEAGMLLKTHGILTHASYCLRAKPERRSALPSVVLRNLL
jgi:hypothetical protein